MTTALPTHQKTALASWLEDDATFATTLLAICLDNFGTDCLSWEPETIRMELTELAGVSPSAQNMSKLLAIISTTVTDTFYNDPLVFMNVCQALSGAGINANYMDLLDCEEAAWGITEVLLNTPPPAGTDKEAIFSEEVRRLLGYILQTEGVSQPPDVLGIALLPSNAQNPGAAYADEPQVFQGIYQIARARKAEITAFLKQQTAELKKQLSYVPLRNRRSNTS